ncbi:MAG TPA: hypothetical protein VFR80_14810, partial [Pyrinomonadaceae bacterium]|nr:hypothetical protein [Pyrinomonadaceae bacterium]
YLYLAILAVGSGLFDVAREQLRETLRRDPGQLLNPRFWRVVRRAWLKLHPDAAVVERKDRLSA